MNVRLRVTGLVFGLGLLGVVAATLYVVPASLVGRPLPMSMPALMAISAAQSALLVLVAALVGGFTRQRVALGAPLIEAAAARHPLPELRPILVAGLLGGFVGALLLIVLASIAPSALAAAQTRFDLPLFVRVLYGGLTEEVLIRWGLMTLLAWLMARVLARRFRAPSNVVMWTAVVVSALVFGAGHLPAAKLLFGPLTAPVVAYVLAGNSAFGIIAGWLYWRHGIESAMLAHAVAHTVAWAAAVVG